MRLFIAEKPSMAREISKCLPENKNIQKRNGYFIQGDDVVTWVVGHVLHQAEPGDYDDKYVRWRPQDYLLCLMSGNYWLRIVVVNSLKR